MSRLGFALMASVFLMPRIVWADATQSMEMFVKAETAIVKFMPNAYLAYYKGHKSESIGCTDKIEWQFVFKEEASAQRPEVGGFVEYTYREIGHECKLLERTLVDTNINLTSYNYLVHHGNLAKVTLEWDEALTLVREKHLDFKWLEAFEVYSPLHPDFIDHVFYAFLGKEAGQMTEIIVDASSGEIEESANWKDAS